MFINAVPPPPIIVEERVVQERNDGLQEIVLENINKENETLPLLQFDYTRIEDVVSNEFIHELFAKGIPLAIIYAIVDCQWEPIGQGAEFGKDSCGLHAKTHFQAYKYLRKQGYNPKQSMEILTFAGFLIEIAENKVSNAEGISEVDLYANILGVLVAYLEEEHDYPLAIRFQYISTSNKTNVNANDMDFAKWPDTPTNFSPCTTEIAWFLNQTTTISAGIYAPGPDESNVLAGDPTTFTTPHNYTFEDANTFAYVGFDYKHVSAAVGTDFQGNTITNSTIRIPGGFYASIAFSDEIHCISLGLNTGFETALYARKHTTTDLE